MNQPPNKRLTLNQWHQRYWQQAGWTQEIRQHLFKKIPFDVWEPLLEVGSGTGAVLNHIEAEDSFHLIGVDLDRASLKFSKNASQGIPLVQADGFQLPFREHYFAVSFCHYLLMWVAEPKSILKEMKRVTRSSGAVIALAEPDHEARIDYPPPLNELGKLQTRVLANQGADTTLGRKIRELFIETGLQKVETGILGSEWNNQPNPKTIDHEWMVIKADLAGQLTDLELEHYQKIDQQAWTDKRRVLFIPTFYALGFVP